MHKEQLTKWGEHTALALAPEAPGLEGAPGPAAHLGDGACTPAHKGWAVGVFRAATRYSPEPHITESAEGRGVM